MAVSSDILGSRIFHHILVISDLTTNNTCIVWRLFEMAGAKS